MLSFVTNVSSNTVYILLWFIDRDKGGTWNKDIVFGGGGKCLLMKRNPKGSMTFFFNIVDTVLLVTERESPIL